MYGLYTASDRHSAVLICICKHSLPSYLTDETHCGLHSLNSQCVHQHEIGLNVIGAIIASPFLG